VVVVGVRGSELFSGTLTLTETWFLLRRQIANPVYIHHCDRIGVIPTCGEGSKSAGTCRRRCYGVAVRVFRQQIRRAVAVHISKRYAASVLWFAFPPRPTRRNLVCTPRPTLWQGEYSLYRFCIEYFLLLCLGSLSAPEGRE